jgi:hypothetical protein
MVCDEKAGLVNARTLILLGMAGVFLRSQGFSFDDTVFNQTPVQDLDLQLEPKETPKPPSRPMHIEPDWVPPGDLPVVAEPISLQPESPPVSPAAPSKEAGIQPATPELPEGVIETAPEVLGTDDLQVVGIDNLTLDESAVTSNSKLSPSETPQTISTPGSPAVSQHPSSPPIGATSTHSVSTEHPASLDRKTLLEAPPLISLHLQDVPLGVALEAIGVAAGKRFVIPSDIEGKATLNLKNKPWIWATDQLLKARKWTWDYQDNVLSVFRDNLFARGPTQPKQFTLEHVKPSSLVYKLMPLMSERGALIDDDAHHKLMAYDVPAVLEVLETLIRSLDKPRKTVYLDVQMVEVPAELLVPLGLPSEGDPVSYSKIIYPDLKQMAQSLNLPLDKPSATQLVQSLEAKNMAKAYRAPAAVLNQHRATVAQSELFKEGYRDHQFEMTPQILSANQVELKVRYNHHLEGAIQSAETVVIAKLGQTLLMPVLRTTPPPSSTSSNPEPKPATQESTPPPKNHLLVFITPIW